MSRSRTGFLRLCIAFAVTAGGLLFAEDAPKPIKVFIFAGQSNMVGADARAQRIDEFPMFQGAGASQTDVLFATLPTKDPNATATWGPLGPGDSFGPEITFARRLKARDAGPIAIIKSAIGGTTVAFDWNPDAPDKGQKLYPRTLRLIQESLKELDRRGLRYQLEAVMWHQGENDMLDGKLNKQYAEGLTRLVARLRTDLHAPGLKWFIAVGSRHGPRPRPPSSNGSKSFTTGSGSTAPWTISHLWTSNSTSTNKPTTHVARRLSIKPKQGQTARL
jgi:hypothetical protein